MALKEVDTRVIPGGGGKVSWHFNAPDGPHYVLVTRPSGEDEATLELTDGCEARDAFYHPFAREDVADVFAAAKVTA